MGIEFEEDVSQPFIRPFEKEKTGLYKLFMKFGLTEEVTKKILIAIFLFCFATTGYVLYSTFYSSQPNKDKSAVVQKTLSEIRVNAFRSRSN